ncbi:RAB6-interacting golgin isoform X2 [Ahaetulla prasina]|uniref:RAB6-interacting golgin isoform X2 n=2 Tax=Ahaetulla prasina TaxID=499056 RepID=UPI002647077F|nr:RAB6-interacting golgin isoform X2 [Ahaetulla prasina]
MRAKLRTYDLTCFLLFASLAEVIFFSYVKPTSTCLCYLDPPGPLPKQQNQRPSVNKSRQCLQQKKMPQKIEEILELPDGAALSPLEKAEEQEPRNQQVEVGLKKSCNSDPTAATSHQLVKKKMELQEKSRWEILQQEQKLMEEKNKRKKAFLAKAIAERSKRTQAETVKLKRIQKQLQALDDMVSADIGILRNRIDQASLEYSCARKRYDKAESEYVGAKLDLQKKTEVKEQLAEHLSTIIQQNELRKAKKLEELMKELEVEADEENLELEIEIEQMLQQQETEARRQEIEIQKLAQVDAEYTDSQTLSKGHENENLRNVNGAA